MNIEPEYLPTEAELDRELHNFKLLMKIGTLKNLMRQEREDKSPQCKPECAIACYDSTVDSEGLITARYIGDSQRIRVAMPGNKKFPAGTHHPQCPPCRKREDRKREISGLKLELGIK